jgi:hypothetical protein
MPVSARHGRSSIVAQTAEKQRRLHLLCRGVDLQTRELVRGFRCLSDLPQDIENKNSG